ncbi:hypothetical protein [Chloroflexus islandicus]|nr:hypothetical protein [Chloroflexus islandicus]
MVVIYDDHFKKYNAILLGSADTFMRAYPPVDGDAREDDLFAGVQW